MAALDAPRRPLRAFRAVTATGPTDGQAGRDRAEAPDAGSATSSNEAWLSDYLGRAAEFWQRAGRAGTLARPALG